VVTGFNAFQYALEVQTALTEACRVVRSGGQVAVCKYGRPKENEFFAFLSALDANGLRLEELPATDAVDRAIERLQLRVAASGEVPAVMSLPSGEALLGALASAGVLADSAGDQSLQTRVATAAAPYRQPDGSYRFENCLKYRIIANTRR
jgi:hypothetical protein